jgi:hypothetical protein
MKMTAARTIMLLAMGTALGCASSGYGTSGGNAPDSRILAYEEISRAQVSGTAYDLISRLRPGFLVSRGQASISNATATSSYPNIYLDGVPYGDISTLRGIEASHVAEVRLFQAWEAQTKFGVGNNGGVIAITTRR